MPSLKPGVLNGFSDIFILFVSSDEAGGAGRPTADQVRVDPVNQWHKLASINRNCTCSGRTSFLSVFDCDMMPRALQECSAHDSVVILVSSRL